MLIALTWFDLQLGHSPFLDSHWSMQALWKWWPHPASCLTSIFTSKESRQMEQHSSFSYLDITSETVRLFKLPICYSVIPRSLYLLSRMDSSSSSFKFNWLFRYCRSSSSCCLCSLFSLLLLASLDALLLSFGLTLSYCKKPWFILLSLTIPSIPWSLPARSCLYLLLLIFLYQIGKSTHKIRRMKTKHMLMANMKTMI